MSIKDRTKVMFAEQLAQMMNTASLEKIRILDLCRQCGATPQTFYYHFRDKYELVAWIFLKDFADVFGDREPGYSPEILEEITKRMEKRKLFYQKAFADQSQNSILQYIQSFNLQIATSAVKAQTGEDLTTEQMVSIKYHVYGIMGMFREWLYGDTDITTTQLTAFLYDKTPDFLQDAFSSYKYSRREILQKSGKHS